jgi:hypothetical protein
MPEWAALTRAFLAHHAPARLREITQELQTLHRQAADLDATISRLHRHAGAWTLLAANPRALTPETTEPATEPSGD